MDADSAETTCTREQIAGLVQRYFSLDSIPVFESRFDLTNHDDVRNESGYRCDPFDIQADFRIAFFGCGWVWGAGVEYSQSVASQVKGYLEAHWDVGIANWNFASPEGSLDEILRLAPTVCRVFEPDLAVVVLPANDRHEHFANGGERLILDRQTDVDRDRDHQHHDAAWRELESRYEGLSSLVDGIASLDGIFSSHGVPWIYSAIDEEKLRQDVKRLLDMGLLANEHYVGSHFHMVDRSREVFPGPQSHSIFARMLGRKIAGMDVLNKAPPSRISQVKKWAASKLGRSIDGSDSDSKKKNDDGSDIYPLW